MIPDVESKTGPRGKRRIVTRSFRAAWTYRSAVISVRVPAGVRFRISGGAPVRGLVKALGPAFSFQDVSAVHDYLYQVRGRVSKSLTLSRAACDAVLTADPADPDWMKPIVYRSVRALGGPAWHSRNEVEHLPDHPI